ncbi:DUF3024 domain-containing protein [Tamlana sp. s12]|uniref:DUF3024 domain-containing protein n=1 Tax=Pseudotamlana carrageenivorans TaxID=2069432 RepID=A0A2I7SLX2_9FLAO|nr:MULTISPECIES: DUF3024 domain-containing protein [Tamlana]AUS06563.1 DUF3024 domain-containing protein [Tamlana carrageenivorans]AUS06867.1 DUF3024 domain-containing protein [Tamlana carrageenivorans]OBQ46704.1 hypothetical protein VQ01_15485 [Tamlana sp. s12]QQY81622.1 DUF3024 domain-containing protein [Tamlana sp. s12]
MKNTAIDINESTIKKYIESLRPEDNEIRKKLDFGYSYDGKVVILYEIRPFWNNPEEIENIEFAKIRFYKSRKEWNLYWMRASGKWEIYDPFPKSTHLEKIVNVIKEDKHGCFFG